MEGVFFIPFPKPKTQLEKCMTWISLCGRAHSNFNSSTISRNTFICSKHFVGGKGPTDSYPNPVPAIQVGSVVAVTKKVRLPPRVRASTPELKHTVNNASTSTATSIDFTINTSISDDDMDISIGDFNETVIFSDSTTQYGNPTTDSSVQVSPVMQDACTQTDSECDNWMRRKLFIDHVESNDKNCYYWTGIQTLSLLTYLFQWFKPCAQNVTLWMGKKRHSKPSKIACKPRTRLLNLFQEYLLVLVRIRRGLDTKEVGLLFGVTQSHVTHVFLTWVNIFYKCCLPLLEWPSRDIVKHNMPKSFKKTFPTTRVIIDCSELYIQTSRSVDAQRLTYSTYKSHNTFKFLLGIAPSGQITYLSKWCDI